MTTHFGLLSPSGVDGSTGFVSSSGDGELGRSLSPQKSVLSRSGRLRPPLPRARRAHERSEQDKVFTVWGEQQQHNNKKTVSVPKSYQDCPRTCAHGYRHGLMTVRSPLGLSHPPQKGLCYADASDFHLVLHLKQCHLLHLTITMSPPPFGCSLSGPSMKHILHTTTMCNESTTVLNISQLLCINTVTPSSIISFFSTLFLEQTEW